MVLFISSGDNFEMALPLTDEDFVRLYTYIHQNYGIDLHKKKMLIVSRLEHSLDEMGYRSFHSYVDDIVSGSRPDLVNPMLVKLTTNYTFFMREQQHFDFMMETVLPWMEQVHQRDKCLAIWSAGCSSGEEPYSISMCLEEYFGSRASVWDTRVLATDISQNVMAHAMKPSYIRDALESLPEGWISKYFVKKSDGEYTVSDAIRRNVIFQPFNLMHPIRWKKRMDLIFCRNVMIYFDQDTKNALVNRFYDATRPGGYLFIGHSEGLGAANVPYDYIKPAIYRKKDNGLR